MDVLDFHYQKKKREVREECIVNNEKEIVADNKESEILAYLQSAAADEKGTAELSIAESNRKMKIINSVMEKHNPELTSLKEELASKLKSVKSQGAYMSSQYETKANALIRAANSTNNVGSLLRVRSDLQDLSIKSVGDLDLLISDITLIIAKINGLEERVLREMSDVILVLEEESKDIDFGTQTEIAGSAITWLQGIASNIRVNTSRLSETVGQKILVNRTLQVQNMTDAQFKEANALEKRENFLASVQEIVGQMSYISRSSYMNMMRLSINYEQALKLKEMVKFCTSGAAQNWTQVGCNRASQYAANADRIVGSTTMNALRFAGMVFARESDADTINLKDQMLSLLNSGDLSGAVEVHDAILSKLEG